MELKLSGINDPMSTPKLQSFSSKLLVKVCELAHVFFLIWTILVSSGREIVASKKNVLIFTGFGVLMSMSFKLLLILE